MATGVHRERTHGVAPTVAGERSSAFRRIFAHTPHGRPPERAAPGEAAVQQDEEARLIEKLRKIEALFARSTTPGERVAAENARERIQARLHRLEAVERAIEYRFSLPDAWSKALFIALLRRYGLSPYRYRGQRRTTVVVRVMRSFVEEVLWPEFQQLDATLRSHLDAVTKRVIARAVHGDDSEVEERPEQGPAGAGRERHFGED